MKYISLILILFCLTGYSQTEIQKLNCAGYHKGKYVMIAPEGDEIHIKRKRNYQIERYHLSGKKHKFKIEWTGDCEYILTLKKTTSKRNQSFVGKGLFCTIISGESDYYSVMVITPEHPSGRKCEVTKLR
jgi:hypothetical protein